LNLSVWMLRNVMLVARDLFGCSQHASVLSTGLHLRASCTPIATCTATMNIAIFTAHTRSTCFVMSSCASLKKDEPVSSCEQRCASKSEEHVGGCQKAWCSRIDFAFSSAWPHSQQIADLRGYYFWPHSRSPWLLFGHVWHHKPTYCLPVWDVFSIFEHFLALIIYSQIQRRSTGPSHATANGPLTYKIYHLSNIREKYITENKTKTMIVRFRSLVLVSERIVFYFIKSASSILTFSKLVVRHYSSLALYLNYSH